MTQSSTQDSPTLPSGPKGVVVAVTVLVAMLAACGAALTPPAAPAAPAGPRLAAPLASTSASPAPTARRIDFSNICRQSSGATVPAGSAAEADAYYAAAAKEIGLQQFDTLDAVLAYVGYPVTAKKLQDALPSELMDSAATHAPPGAVLATRFFAPKITDVSPVNTPASKVGWRKLVRLQATPGSAAQANGIDAAYVLFNLFAPINAKDPFDRNDSVNTQVMLVSSKPGMSPIYWFDYGQTTPAGASLSKELDAFFDAGHTPENAGKRSYFVPCGCIACHGGLQLDRTVTPPAPSWDPDKALLNYLDTDHWFDRTRPGEDFAALAAPVIIDQGGFEVIRTLNAEMRDQNQRVQPGSIQHRAATHWVDLHASSSAYVDNLALRALPSTSTLAVQWNGADPADMAALKRFNHYCFRCHGSVEFDVFDKSMVISLRSLLLARLQPRGTLTDPRATMPPDRDMADADRGALRAFVLGH